MPMPRRRLLAIEASLVAAAIAVIVLIVASPFGSAAPSQPPTRGAAPQESVAPLGSDGASPVAVLSAAERGENNGESVPVATPEDAGCEPADGPAPLTDSQILSYYGNPYVDTMGILGELPPEELVARLQEHARLYDSLNGPRGVQPALHLVYATAQSEPYPEGLYLLYVDGETLEEYIDLACREGLLIFLDLQIGLSDVETELAKIMPYLERPHVHAALDPEFAMPAGEVPGESIGSLDAADVNAAQAVLQRFLDTQDLPDKVLIVHQFTHGMLTRPELIEDYPRVSLVIDMDGFGPSEIKRVKYGWFAAPAEHSGIKLFFRQDEDLMSETDVLGLDPDLIIYQ